MDKEKVADLGVNECGNLDKETVRLPTSMQSGIGLGVASLILGLISLPFSIVIIGVGFGFVGVILAFIHLSRHLPFKAIAVWGLVLSGIGTIAGGAIATYQITTFYSVYKSMRGFEETQFDEYIGTVGADLTLKDIDGNEIRLSQLRGKRIVLDFWATWCPPCIKEVPHFIELRTTTDVNQLAIIGISDEPEAVVKPFIEKNGINYQMVSEEYAKFPEPYNRIDALPTTFFINKEGVIENVSTGYHSLEELKENALGINKD